MDVENNRLSKYEPTEDGNQFIASLVPLPHKQREALLIRFWISKDKDWPTFLDGFHFLIREVLDSRKKGEKEALLTLNGDLIHDFVKQTKELKFNYSYPSGEAFFEMLQGIEPSIFASSQQVNVPLAIYFPQKKKSNPEFGFPEEYNDSVGEKCIKIYESSTEPFEVVMELLPAFRKSQAVKIKFQQGDKSILPEDVQLAEATFNDIRTRVLPQAILINEGLPYIYEAHRYFSDVILLHKIYNHYMARFLVIKETRFETENFLLGISREKFDYGDPDFTPSKTEEYNGFTKKDLWEKYSKQLAHITTQMECRYRKRQLNALLKEASKYKQVIAELRKIVERDPVDIRTHILLAQLLSKTSNLVKEHGEKISMREESLRYCKSAHSDIDDYLNLQGIEKLKERDQLRVGFIKTIAAIRIPIIKGTQGE